MTKGLGGQSPANVAQFLKGIDFPCKKANLVEHAKKNNAEATVLEAIEAFPDQEFGNMAEVMEAYGRSREDGGEEGMEG